MKSRLQMLSDNLKSINDNIDALYLVAAEMVEDFNKVEKSTSSTERLSASTLQATATALDSNVRGAMQELKELSTALGHEIDTDFNR